MSKVENNSQIVNKEVFKLTVEDPKEFAGLNNLTRPTYNVLRKYAYFIEFLRSSYYAGVSKDSMLMMEFKEFSDYETFDDVTKLGIAIVPKLDIEEVRQAADELVSKGYLFRDTDGTLAFVKERSL